MTALISVELLRILSRRIVRVVGLLALAAILIASVVVFARSHRLQPGEQQGREQQARTEWQAQIDACARGEFGVPQDEIPPGTTLREFCQEAVIGDLIVEDPRFRLTAVKDVLAGTSGFLITLLLVLGASFVGAEWHAGTMSTFLTWEPRRVRVFVAKMLAAASFAFAGFLIVQAVLGLALVPAAALRGTTEGTDITWLGSTLAMQVRAALMASVAAGIGLSLASIGRNTALALGVGFVYFSILEPFLRAVRAGWQSWFLSDNVATFISGETGGFIEGRSPVEAALLIAAYTLGLTLVALEMFRRRDVT
jgi:ABC-2 type transport system permease protein